MRKFENDVNGLMIVLLNRVKWEGRRFPYSQKDIRVDVPHNSKKFLDRIQL